MSKNFVSLEQILGTDVEALTAIKEGDYPTEKLGLLPFQALTQAEYKQAKKDCMKYVKNGKGGMELDFDDEKLKVRIVALAVDKDKRSSFTFMSKALLEKLGVVTADHAIEKLLSPGEIHNIAMEIQDLSGFGEKAQKDNEEAVKNS